MARRINNAGIRRMTHDAVAQIYQRRTGEFAFRYHDGKRYRYAKELAGHDLGWPTFGAAETAARGFGIKKTVDVTDEWDDRRVA